MTIKILEEVYQKKKKDFRSRLLELIDLILD